MFNDPTNPQVFDLSDSIVNGGIGQQYWKIVLNGGGSASTKRLTLARVMLILRFGYGWKSLMMYVVSITMWLVGRNIWLRLNL